MDTIRLAFSPDSDDIFMFWALLNGKVDAPGLRFVHERHDTETLNAMAEQGEVDVIAVSIARYATLAERYLLLAHGMSVGRGYGPVVVAPRATPLGSLAGKRVGVPGLRTTAYMVLRLLLPDFEPVVVPIAPYARAFDAVRRGEVEAALLIHEGRLTYEREGFELVADVGAEWERLTGLPLPLGGNAIRRALGPERVARVSAACRASILWAQAHRETMIDALLAAEARDDVRLDRAMLDRYLAMYANADTAGAARDTRRAVSELFRRGHERGILPAAIVPDIVD